MKKRILYLLPLSLSCLGFSKGPINPDTPLAEMTIFAYANDPYLPIMSFDNGEDNNAFLNRGSLTGHAFLQIKNTSGGSLSVGHVTLGNNSSVLVSCWPDMNGYNHSGIWYNRENFDLNGWQNCSKASLTTTVDSTGLSSINYYLTSLSNNYYSIPEHDCSMVSAEIWNNVVGGSSLALTTSGIPYYVKLSILSKSSASTTTNYDSHSYCGYVSSSNTFVLY